MARVLVVDRDGPVRAELGAYLAQRGHDVNEVATFDELELAIRGRPPDLALVDEELPDRGDRDLLAAVRRIDARIPVVVLTSDATLEHAVQAIKRGAENFVAKPLDLPALHVIVQRVLEGQRVRRRSVASAATAQRRELDPFAGASRAIQELSEHAHRVLDSHAPVLIQGETGTGKGVLAAWLHQHGPRAEEAFVDINCAGLSRDLVESELFGHERGAFTGATTSKLGLLDVAHRGTAFLDEIGEIDLLLQPRLLKVLEEQRFRRLGDVRDHVVDVRLIAATNRDLARRSREGTFRADLFYRINTVSLLVPALRHRREDIPLLASQIASALGHAVDFTHEALRAMEAYDWPGNVRELRNVIERAVLISNRAPRITPHDLRFDNVEAPGLDPDELVTLEEAERRHIERVLAHERGSVDRAAVRLGVSRSTLYQKLRRYREAKSG